MLFKATYFSEGCLCMQYFLYAHVLTINTVEYLARNRSTFFYDVSLTDEEAWNRVKRNTMKYHTYNTMQDTPVQYNTIQCNAIQYNTTQYNTVQSNAI